MQQPPYDTGRVKIGSCYEPPRRVEMSGDMERLQSALLGHRGPRVDIDFVVILERLAITASMAMATVLLLLFINPQ